MIKETMQAVSDVIERACGYGGDMVCLAVAMPQSITPYLEKSHEEWEELWTWAATKTASKAVLQQKRRR